LLLVVVLVVCVDMVIYMVLAMIMVIGIGLCCVIGSVWCAIIMCIVIVSGIVIGVRLVSGRRICMCSVVASDMFMVIDSVIAKCLCLWQCMC